MKLFMDSTSFYKSPGDFKIFFELERKLYTLLVTHLLRNPVESMQTMALWLWFERAGQNKVISSILSLPHILINELADEAVTCLNCISNPQFPSSIHGEIPLTHRLMKKGVCLQFFHENRLAIKIELRRMITDVCVELFKDILQEVIMRKLVSRNMARNQIMMQSLTVEQSSIYGFPQNELGNEIPQPMIQVNQVPPDQSFTYGFSQLGNGVEIRQRRIQVRDHPTVDYRTMLSPVFDQSFIHDFSRLGIGAEIPQKIIQESEVPPDDRTMFVTFSKGYPVTESEVKEFFNWLFGDCIKSVHMQQVKPDEQSLYARIVFCTPSIIEHILKGENKAKFTINGKHVWTRKCMPKLSNSSPPLMLPDSIPGTV